LDETQKIKQLDALQRFHREREEWQREQQKLRQKAEAEMTDSNTREYIEPAGGRNSPRRTTHGVLPIGRSSPRGFVLSCADLGCRWRARLAWMVGRENDESEIQDSRGIRHHARTRKGAKGSYCALGLTEWLVSTLLLVRAEVSDGSIHRSASGKMPYRHSVSSFVLEVVTGGGLYPE
jgi:hypothetical protein